MDRVIFIIFFMVSCNADNTPKSTEIFQKDFYEGKLSVKSLYKFDTIYEKCDITIERCMRYESELYICKQKHFDNKVSIIDMRKDLNENRNKGLLQYFHPPFYIDTFSLLTKYGSIFFLEQGLRYPDNFDYYFRREKGNKARQLLTTGHVIPYLQAVKEFEEGQQPCFFISILLNESVEVFLFIRFKRRDLSLEDKKKHILFIINNIETK